MQNAVEGSVLLLHTTLGKLMPPLPKFFRDLLARAVPVTSTAAGHFDGQPAQSLRTVAAQGIDLLGDGMGAVLAQGGVAASAIAAPMTAARLRGAPGVQAVLEGAAIAPGGKSKAVQPIQRALQAVAARTPGADAALRLSNWGADGDFGGETVAGVKAMQTRLGLTADGTIGPNLVKGLIDALDGTTAPDLFEGVDPIALVSPGARKMVAIAKGICEASPSAPFEKRVGGQTYSYSARVFGTEAHVRGKLRAPGGVSYGLRPGTEYWKCNIFAGTVIALAGLPVSSFHWSRTASSLHFPRAERFGPRQARLPGWKMVMELDHRDPDDETQPLVGHAQETDISELLLATRPGDLLFVDHPGAPGNDGGHCRVCTAVADPDDPDLAPAFAQASQDKAKISRDGLAKLSNGAEIQFWLLRYVG